MTVPVFDRESYSMPLGVELGTVFPSFGGKKCQIRNQIDWLKEKNTQELTFGWDYHTPWNFRRLCLCRVGTQAAVRLSHRVKDGSGLSYPTPITCGFALGMNSLPVLGVFTRLNWDQPILTGYGGFQCIPPSRQWNITERVLPLQNPQRF